VDNARTVDDHRQYLLSGALAMVIDQDPDMEATMALRYLFKRFDTNGVKNSRMSCRDASSTCISLKMSKNDDTFGGRPFTG
jgi:hypothetical protein